MMQLSFNSTPLWGGLAALFFCAQAHAWQEDFQADPVSRQWRIHGDTNLFHWHPANQNLEVTWDSSRPNSYFYRPLGTVLARDNDFSMSFDLRLQDIAIGTTPGKPYAFEISMGFLCFTNATQTNFFRGTGTNSPNLVEFAYFPDSGYGATVAPSIMSSNCQLPYAWIYQDLTLQDLFHVDMRYTASNQTLLTSLSSNGVAVATNTIRLPGTFSDFRLDTFAISSYSDAGQDPFWSGSVLAHGTVDNLVINTPQPPVSDFSGSFTGQAWQADFTSQTNWFYRLEGSSDLKTWSTIVSAPGTGGRLSLQDSQLHLLQFYRLTAERP